MSGLTTSLSALKLGLQPVLCFGIRRLSTSSSCLYVMSNSQRGVRHWEAKETEGKTDSVHIATLKKQLIDNVDRCGYSKCSALSKIFDNVRSVEDLNEAEEALLRRGYNPIRSSTPLVVIRACVRVGKSNRALHYIKNKVQYGLFPSVKTFNILMDAFLLQKDYKGITKTYNEMIKNELEPNATSYFLAVFGYLLQENSPENTVEMVKELCEKCMGQSHKMGVRAYHLLLRVLQERNDKENSQEILDDFHSKYNIYNTFDVNWRIRGFLYHDNIEKVFDILNHVCNSPSLSVSKEVFKCIDEHILSHQNDQHQLKLKEYNEKLVGADKLK